jgi:clan AA aspartic protease
MIKKSTPIEDELPSQRDFRTMAPSANDSQERKTLMGEVRVKVTLTNAVDEALVRRGLLSADKVRHYEADALVASGAVRSVLPSHVVKQLGLAIVRTTRVTYANDGPEDVDVTEVVGIDINGRRTTEETLVLGSEVLIGQTVLESLDLLVDCTNHRVVGNPAHPDQPMIKIKFLVTNKGTRVERQTL